MKRGCAVLATNRASPASRVLEEPAFVLQSFDWSESSLIVEVLTRHMGRITLVAKGAKRPSSNFRPILLPFQLIKVSYSGDAEIRTLKSAVWGGGSVMPKGEALLSGFYLNELILRLLQRDDPHSEFFDVYQQTVSILTTQDDSVKAPALRSFELLLLKDLGWLPDLSRQSLTLQPLKDSESYVWIAEVGLREVGEDEQAGLPGSLWRTLGESLSSTYPLTTLIRCCAEMASQHRQSLQSQLRSVLHYHCGVSKLRTRQFMMDLQSL